MPLVRIDLTAGRDAANVREIADAIHEAIVSVYGIPPRDRFQIVTEHLAGQIIAEDAGLGFERSGGVVMIQIFTQRGRSDETKQALYAAVAGHLSEVGVDGADVFIGYVENGPQDWSFGFGRAQYLSGELAVPAR
ncbi:MULTISPECIES: tautomerase family protein [unclassified Plantibacter]|uniref:tautomerase family protein n=1 Tax=unclassified Plantibacter TaxID=2624265 RepID=UPI0006F97443|nr:MULTISPECIES: tautomerase family protein [unclassified Plantibacter]KQQ51344.1 tautomerase [Plantibacter sp. Leaf314]